MRKIFEWLDGRLILLLVFLNAPSFLPLQGNLRALRHGLSYLLYVIFLSLVISLIISLLRRANPMAAKILKGGLLTICATIFLADVFALWNYGAPLNRTMLEVVLATTPNEATEFLSAYVLQAKFLAIVAALALIFVVLAKEKLPHVDERFLAAVLILAVVISCARLTKRPVEVFERGNSLTRLAVILPEAFENLRQYESLTAAAKNPITLTKNESNLPLVIFVLGESTTRNHMQLYGYDLPTTPLLAERNSRGELKIFTDVVSPHSHTLAVLKEIFSFLRHENESDRNSWLSKGTLLDILNAAGYETIWLSNQEASGIYGNIGRLYAETCTRRNFTRLRDSLEVSDVDFDEALLPLFDEDLESAHGKSFYVLHLMGTHSTYNRRYPSAYEKFSAEEKIASTRADYDNAVLYNDFVVDEIIRRVEDLDALVIYVSDHGEDVYDEKNFAGHEESSPSRFMIEIPFVVWTSEKFRAAHPELEAKFAAAVDKPFMTDDLIHLLLDALEIATPDFDETLSPLNEKYNAGRERVYGGKVYDKELGLH